MFVCLLAICILVCLATLAAKDIPLRKCHVLKGNGLCVQMASVAYRGGGGFKPPPEIRKF